MDGSRLHFPGGYFFASVMDGHGGKRRSAWLRENLFKSLAASCEGASRGRATEPGALVQDGTKGADTSPRSAKTGYTSADDSLIDHIARLGEPECWSGSTCTSVLVRDDRIVCANVGDSRALLVRASKGVELTQDHRPVGTSSKGRQEMQRVVNCGVGPWADGCAASSRCRARSAITSLRVGDSTSWRTSARSHSRRRRRSKTRRWCPSPTFSNARGRGE